MDKTESISEDTSSIPKQNSGTCHGNFSLTRKEFVITFATLFGFLFNLVAISSITRINPLIVKPFLCVSAIVSFVVCPLIIISEKKLTESRGLRQLINQMRNNIRKLKKVNSKLQKSISNLSCEIKRLKEIETSIYEVAQKQGISKDEVTSLLREYKNINDSFIEVIKANAIQRTISLFIECDKDHDLIIKGNELELFIMGLLSIEEIIVADYEHVLEKLHSNSYKECYVGYHLNDMYDLIKYWLEEDENDEGQKELNVSVNKRKKRAVSVVDCKTYLERRSTICAG